MGAESGQHAPDARDSPAAPVTGARRGGQWDPGEEPSPRSPGPGGGPPPARAAQDAVAVLAAGWALAELLDSEEAAELLVEAAEDSEEELGDAVVEAPEVVESVE